MDDTGWIIMKASTIKYGPDHQMELGCLCAECVKKKLMLENWKGWICEKTVL